MSAVEVINLTRVFDSKGRRVIALDDVNLKISKGEILGLLGANGAGKTTLVKILATLLLPTSGYAYVYGYDVIRDAKQVRRIINLVSGGETPGYGLLTVKENLWFFSQLYGLSSSDARSRIDALIKDMELEQYRDVRVHKLSTGYKQRLNLARGFINDPKIVLLDEPTLGLDVINAKHIRSYIKRWVSYDTERAILLTTHYLTEAEEICDKIAIIYKGKIVAYETPDALKRSLINNIVIEMHIMNNSYSYANTINIIKNILTENSIFSYEINGKYYANNDGEEGMSIHRDDYNNKDVTRLKIILNDEYMVPNIVEMFVKHGLRVLYVNKNNPTLEDVYIRYVSEVKD